MYLKSLANFREMGNNYNKNMANYAQKSWRISFR